MLDYRTIKKIRAMRKNGCTLEEISNVVGVGVTTVFNVANNYTHYDPSFTPTEKQKVDGEQLLKIRKETGKSYYELAVKEALISGRTRPLTAGAIRYHVIAAELAAKA